MGGHVFPSSAWLHSVNHEQQCLCLKHLLTCCPEIECAGNADENAGNSHHNEWELVASSLSQNKAIHNAL